MHALLNAVRVQSKRGVGNESSGPRTARASHHLSIEGKLQTWIRSEVLFFTLIGIPGERLWIRHLCDLLLKMALAEGERFIHVRSESRLNRLKKGFPFLLENDLPEKCSSERLKRLSFISHGLQYAGQPGSTSVYFSPVSSL